MQGTDRRQIAWINQRHITEDALDEAITAIINAYNNFSLPRLWGSGKHASADGTRWDLYEQNLLSEYHIRYGGYGGIGYYHVSDTYIALSATSSLAVSGRRSTSSTVYSRTKATSSPRFFMPTRKGNRSLSSRLLI